MKIQPTKTTGVPQPFEVNETFFSTTDSRGVITDGNGVFCRTSGYALPEMIGQPHNLVRHPDMPRVVFRQLWAAAKATKPFMGYVKNQARNGNHYWVFAIILPIDGGFLSVRIKPTSPRLATIEKIYGRLLACEAKALADGRSEGHAASAAAVLLEAELHQLGFATYEAFSHEALNTEIKSRDDEIARRGLRLFPAGLDGDSANDEVGALYRNLLGTYDVLETLFRSLDAFIALRDAIRQRHDAVRNTAEEFRLNALNAHIAAHPLGEQGRTLSTVAQILNAHGQSLSRNVSALATEITGTTAALADIASNLASARIQLEMLLSFLAELWQQNGSGEGRGALLAKARHLRAAFSKTLNHASAALRALQSHMPAVIASKEQLRKDIVYLQVAQISGLTEVSRLADGASLHATFTGLRTQIETGKRELDELGSIVAQLTTLANDTPPQMQRIRETMERTQQTTGAPATQRSAITARPSDDSFSMPTPPRASAPQVLAMV